MWMEIDAFEILSALKRIYVYRCGHGVHSFRRVASSSTFYTLTARKELSLYVSSSVSKVFPSSLRFNRSSHKYIAQNINANPHDTGKGDKGKLTFTSSLILAVTWPQMRNQREVNRIEYNWQPVGITRKYPATIDEGSI